MKYKLSKVLFVYMTNAILLAQAFILDTPSADCFPEYPCTCNSQYGITCDHANLTEIPPLPKTDTVNRSVNNFDLRYNYITEIPADAFLNISYLKDLRLDNNQISVVDVDAFNGIEDTLHLLSLRNNRLSSLPDVLLRLTHLSVLTLEGNHISVLQPTYMSSLGSSLSILSVSLAYFQSWPKQLHYLMNLIHLHISDVPFSDLPLDAFNGFETSLSVLDINNSSFRRIPSAVCHLTHLRVLIYQDNQKTRHPIFEPCRNPLEDVYSLQLIGNNFNTYPDILHTFPNIQNLAVTNNPNLLFVDSIIANDSVKSISNLDVSMNSFERIPSAVRFYVNVETLNASFNLIKTIEYGDLSDLRKLSYLYLQGNPLLYVDNLAFTMSDGAVLPLADLNLQNTSLDVIPEAVAGLPSLTRLRISGKPIECSCTMRYIKHWLNVTVEGECEFTGMPIQTYIQHDLQKCY